MSGPLGAIGRNDEINTLLAQANKLTQCLVPSPRGRPANGAESESFDDAINDFPVTMLADQNLGVEATVAQGYHQLLPVPECQDDIASFPVYSVNRFESMRLQGHRLAEKPNRSRAEKRQDVEFQCVHLLSCRPFIGYRVVCIAGTS